MERSNDSLADGGDGGARRACDQCRVRKIRCDKESPCANCRIAHRACSSTGIGQKPKEPRQRVLISTQYERKIDHIEDRLENIERLLRTISSAVVRHDSETPHGTDTPRVYPPSARDTADAASSATALDQDSQDASTFEGNSSLAAHTVFASEFLEHAVERTSLRDLSPNMQAGLSSLKQLVGMQSRGTAHEVRFPSPRPLPKGGFHELPMPPVGKVISILKELKESTIGTSSMIKCFMAADTYTEYCRRVFFPTEDFSLTTYIIVNAGLCYVFQEKAGVVADEVERAEWWEYHSLCQDNMEIALGHINLLVPARRETIEALLLSAFYAIETSRPSLAWLLNSTAAIHCQTLGWHRQQVTAGDIPNEQLDTQAALFWFAYILDKGLAVRLGRAAVIRDWDITLPRSLGATVDSSDTWKEVVSMWIRHSEVQGRAYEQLYSPHALSLPEERRVEHARAMAEDLKQILKETMMMREQAMQMNALARAPEEVNQDVKALEMTLQTDEVSYWSSLTLIYRAIPPPPGFPSIFSQECIEAAREAFRTHQDCMRLMDPGRANTQATYLSWTILYSPFVSFIVIFCHVIESSDSGDLRRLSDFVNSLEPSCTKSGAVDKLHKLCQVLYNVAALYVETKAQQQEDADMIPVGNDFDMYLSALGLMPASTGDGGGGFEGEMPSVMASSQTQTAQLGDWFSGNRYMMGFLEEDLPFSWE